MDKEKTRHCIICDKIKLESEFNTEHIVAEKLGNRWLKTKRVCRCCNGAMGSILDSALQDFSGVSDARRKRVLGASNTVKKVPLSKFVDPSDFESFGDLKGHEMLAVREDSKSRSKFSDDTIFVGFDNENNGYAFSISRNTLTNEIKGAILKIAYEVTHRYIGDIWLKDDKAVKIRNILYGYVESAEKTTENAKEKRIAARELTDAYAENITLYKKTKESYENFYAKLMETRDEYVEGAEDNKTCVNSLWFVPSYKAGCDCSGLAVAFDIEGFYPGLVVVSDSATCGKPILINKELSVNIFRKI